MHSTMARNMDATHWQVQELEGLADEMEQLLSRNIRMPDSANMRSAMKVLERWRQLYHNHVVNADTFFETSKILLANFHDYLKSAWMEKQRMAIKTTGGRDQALEADALLKALRITERILNRDMGSPYRYAH